MKIKSVCSLLLVALLFSVVGPAVGREQRKKILIVYYSYTGNTEVVATTLAQVLGADLRRIEDVKNYYRIHGYFKARKDAMMDKNQEIRPFNYDFSGYDTIFVGCPVWGKATPPQMNEFLSGADFTNKKVIAFLTMGEDYGKALEKMTQKITVRGGTVIDSFTIATRTLRKEEIAEKARRFANDFKTKIF
jgi:flavodoxin